MERRDFFYKSTAIAALGLISPISNATTSGFPLIDPLKPFLLPSMLPLEHKGSSDIRVWVRSSMTNGLYSSVECAVAPKIMGPPPHMHKELDELMYVIEGTASILIGDDIVEVKAGGWHLRPRLIKHTFWNASDKSLRFIDMYFNQPFEDFLERIYHELTAENGFPEGSDAKTKEINKLNEKFGLIYSPTAFDERQEIVKKFALC